MILDLFINKLSIFEALMLFCFGVAWPFSIIKGLKSKSIEGKSVLFSYVVFLGYIFGIAHKLLYNFDAIIYLYILNGSMVFIDLLIYYKNKKSTATFQEHPNQHV
jgi:hypothetical protein